MPSRIEVDEIHEKTADSGVSIKDNLKLSSGNAIKNASGADLLTEGGTLDNVTLGPGSGATNLKMAAVKLTADGRLERSDGTDILLESSNVATLKNVTLESSVVFPTGHVIQVVQTVKTDTFDSTADSGTFADITGMSATIKPASTSNKILIQCSLTNGASTHSLYFKLQHNGSGSYADVSGAVGTSTSSRTPMTFGGVGGTSDNSETATNSITFLDSPSKDTPFTYKVQGSARTSGNTWTINRPYVDTDANYTGRGISTLTLMEIKG